MKTTKIKQIPMLPTTHFNKLTNQTKYLDILSHANYGGEVCYRYINGENIKILPKMVDNIPWNDTLVYDGFYRGRSAAGCIFTNDKNQVFTVFMKDLDIFIPKMHGGVITDQFIYCKRGMNYGVTLYTP